MFDNLIEWDILLFWQINSIIVDKLWAKRIGFMELLWLVPWICTKSFVGFFNILSMKKCHEMKSLGRFSVVHHYILCFSYSLQKEQSNFLYKQNIRRWKKINKNCVFASLVFPLEDFLKKILRNAGEYYERKSYGFLWNHNFRSNWTDGGSSCL